MKIYFLTRNNIFFENSASANRARSLLEGLAFLGAEICLLITDGFLTQNERNEYKTRSKYGLINYKYLSKALNQTLLQRRINKYIIFPLYTPFLFRRILKIVSRGSLNSILWTGCDLKYFKFISKIKKRDLSLYTFLELSEYLNYQEFNIGNFVHKFESRLRQEFFEHNGFYLYDGIALMTRVLYNHYSNFQGAGPHLLHLPMSVDLDRFKIQCEVLPGFRKPYIAFVGLMNDSKDGVSIIIDAFAKISDKYKKYRLYLVGGWNYDTPAHLNKIRRLNLEDRAYWMGEYERDRIPAIILNADLLVLPRPNTKQTAWGFPTKLGEYLATGNPVCATRVGEVPDYLVDGESVFFAEPGSIDSFAESMDRALSEPTRAKQVGRNGRLIAEKHFNSKIQAKQLFEFLEALSSKSRDLNFRKIK